MTLTLLAHVEAGIDHIRNGYRLLGDEQDTIPADLRKDNDVTEEQRPIRLHRSSLDARQIAAEYPLATLDGQREGLALGKHHPRLEILEREQGTTLSQRLHEPAAHGDLAVGRLQLVDHRAKVLVLLGVHVTVARQQLHQLEDLPEVLQRPVDEHGEIGPLARHSRFRDEGYELGARLPRLVDQDAVRPLDPIAVLLVRRTNGRRLGEVDPRGEVHVRLLIGMLVLVLLLAAAQLLEDILGDAQQLVDVLEQGAVVIRRDQVLALQQRLDESLHSKVQGRGEVLLPANQLEQKAPPVIRDGHNGLGVVGSRRV